MIVDALSDDATVPRLLQHKLALAASVYTIWCERNRHIFTNAEMSVSQLVKSLLTVVSQRLAWMHRKKKMTHYGVGS